MTTILGLRSGGVSYLAADSRLNSGDCILPVKGNKILHFGRWRIATTGARRLNAALEEGRDRIAAADTIGRLACAIRVTIEADGFSRTQDPGSAAFGAWGLIVADETAVWTMSNDLSFAELDDGRPWGQGSGGSHGEAACVAFLARGDAPEQALSNAVRVASMFDPWTDDRVQIVRIPGDGMEALLWAVQAESPLDTSRFTGRHSLGLSGT